MKSPSTGDGESPGGISFNTSKTFGTLAFEAYLCSQILK